MMGVKVVLAFAFLTVGATAVAIKEDFDYNLLQMSAEGHSQLDSLGLANISTEVGCDCTAYLYGGNLPSGMGYNCAHTDTNYDLTSTVTTVGSQISVGAGISTLVLEGSCTMTATGGTWPHEIDSTYVYQPGYYCFPLPTGNDNMQTVTLTCSAGSQSSATGDPHLQNVYGERFDLMKPGKHVLVNIPRGASAESALLRVEAQASKLGGLCEDIYFTDLNITGPWASAKQVGGYHFASQGSGPETSKWTALGAIEFKVVRAHTNTGILYLNFYIKHLGRAGFAVGGLLGEDDHTVESAPSAACVKQMSLKKLPSSLYSRDSAVSSAQGSFA